MFWLRGFLLVVSVKGRGYNLAQFLPVRAATFYTSAQKKPKNEHFTIKMSTLL